MKVEAYELQADVLSGDALNALEVTATGSTTARPLSARFAERANVRDEGATGDGATDDTAAINLAFTRAKSGGKALYFPAGTYLHDGFTYGQPSLATQVPVIGDGSKVTKLKKRGSDSGVLFKVSSALASGFVAETCFMGLTFEGIAGNTEASFQAYDMVRCLFMDVVCKSSLIGIDLRGGIANQFINVQASSNATGAQITRYTGGYAGYPNLNAFYGSRFLDNTSWGIDFDYGRLLQLEQCEIEGNGTAANSSTGGIRVGANIGTESGLLSPGLEANGCWFEANKGNAAVQCASGENRLRSPYFIANADATYDSYFSGGVYYIETPDYDTNKSPNHHETAAVGSGNLILFPRLAGTYAIDAAKTSIVDTVLGLVNMAVDTPSILVRATTPSIRAVGGGTNNPLSLYGKGVNGIRVRDGGDEKILLDVFNGAGASADTWATIFTDAAGSVKILPEGPTNASLILGGKGTGVIGAVLASVDDYADDATAAAASVPVGGFYRTASALKIRVA